MVKLKTFLQLDSEQRKLAKVLRQKSIDDAVLLVAGPSRDQKNFYDLWEGSGYVVGVGKPGKESARSVPKPHDMWPFIRKGEKFEEKSASFKDIFLELEHMGNESQHALELLGCLLVRSALMLDHEIENDAVVYRPPKEVLEEIAQFIPSMFNVPLEVFLQYIDTIALNEDVKYQRNLNSKGLKYGITAGRPNNLLTCAHLVAVLLNRSGIVEFAYRFSQLRGVSPLNEKELTTCFPMLADPNVAAKTDESSV